ncbi:hypothetical protein DQ04_05541000 [Trypanosoma grayi]|uniref:hypothetical protein n=1 Tax=Trypanosoma grayi TaxID=71804 RepID=UPI0004F4BB03|nr:hypothetical protein DQ04_05541000 [Trypanosoma grayi]KEG09245.1 hypothetical protein DQ04_05541000 [Trypanosoma grayi]
MDGSSSATPSYDLSIFDPMYPLSDGESSSDKKVESTAVGRARLTGRIRPGNGNRRGTSSSRGASADSLEDTHAVQTWGTAGHSSARKDRAAGLSPPASLVRRNSAGSGGSLGIVAATFRRTKTLNEEGRVVSHNFIVVQPRPGLRVEIPEENQEEYEHELGEILQKKVNGSASSYDQRRPLGAHGRSQLYVSGSFCSRDSVTLILPSIGRRITSANRRIRTKDVSRSFWHPKGAVAEGSAPVHADDVPLKTAVEVEAPVFRAPARKLQPSEPPKAQKDVRQHAGPSESADGSDSKQSRRRGFFDRLLCM